MDVVLMAFVLIRGLANTNKRIAAGSDFQSLKREGECRMPTIDGRQRVQRVESLSSSGGERKIHAFIGESSASCTIKDIARLAEVSTATVSRVANGAESVS